MSKFKIGDKVERIAGYSITTPFGNHGTGWSGIVNRIQDDILEFVGGHRGYADMYKLYQPEPKCKCICAEDAKRILEAQGYTVTPPQSGVVYVHEWTNGYGNVQVSIDFYKSTDPKKKLLAIVPWTEGDGL